MRERYFHWLLKFIGNGLCRKNSYFELLKYLFNTDYYWSIPMDEDRAADGVDLRYRFVVECGEDLEASYMYLSGPPSVLEVLIALSIKMEYIARGSIELSKAGQWFWGMIKCLNIFDYYDGNFNSEEVEYCLNRWFENEDNASIFPNGHGELWSQAMNFLSDLFL
jgi:hypothetical protein